MSDLLTYLRQKSKDAIDRMVELDDMAVVGGVVDTAKVLQNSQEMAALHAELECIDIAMGYVHEWMETQS